MSRGKAPQDMFEAYFDSEMKPLDILQSATYLAAQSINQEKRIGALQADAKADIIAVKGDIENDFVNTIANVKFVMKNGKVYVNEIG